MNSLYGLSKGKSKQINNVNINYYENKDIVAKNNLCEVIEEGKTQRALWKAVVMQALVDLKSRSNKKMAKIHRVRSIMWFSLFNKDFLTVCSFGGLDPYYVYQKAQEIKLENPLI